MCILFMKKIALGLEQLFLFLGHLILMCILMGCGVAMGCTDGAQGGAVCGYVSFALCLLGGFVLWLYAVIGMGTGSIKDSNGVETYW